MESCLICGDTSAIISTRPIDKVNQFIQQFGRQGQGLKFTKQSEVILCEDCHLGVWKAAKWGIKMEEVQKDVRSLQRIILKMNRQIKSLEGSYQKELRRLEGKIRSLEVGDRTTEKAEAFRKVILNGGKDLCKFQDAGSRSKSAAKQQVSQKTDSLKAAEEDDNDIIILEEVENCSDIQELEEQSHEGHHVKHSGNFPKRGQSSSKKVTGCDGTAIPSTSSKSRRKKKAKSRPLQPCLSEPPKRKKAKVSMSESVAAPPHPLLNNVVLKNLFRYLNKEDLRSSRLVHSKWNFEAGPYLKKRGSFLQIRTYPEKPNFNYLAHFQELSNYIKNTTPDNIPFSVQKICFSSDLPVYGSAWRELLKVLATRVTEVIVIVQDYSSPFPMDLTFSKLTTLRVRQGSWSYLTTMVQCSPNLKTLELEQAYYINLDSVAQLAKDLKLETFKIRSLIGIGRTRARQNGLVVLLKSQKDTLVHVVVGADILRDHPYIAEEIPNARITTE